MGTKNSVLYSCVLLDDRSRDKIISHIKSYIINDWELIVHHMTICMGELPQELKPFVGIKTRLVVNSIAYDDKVIAVGVSGFYSKNEYPHITICVNRNNGGKPYMSNNLKNWKNIPSFSITGTVIEIK